MTTEWEQLAEWDWAISPYGRILHYPLEIDNRETLDHDWYAKGKAACGFVPLYFSIPGMFTRMGAKRCDKCCDALGYPRGVGSPKNDDACRPMVHARQEDLPDDD